MVGVKIQPKKGNRKKYEIESRHTAAKKNYIFLKPLRHHN